MVFVSYIASVEVDQRQNFIQQADTLREMVGASRMIEYSVQIAEEELKKSDGVRLFWPVSGSLRFHTEDIGKLGAFLARYCERLESVSLTASVGVVACGPDFDVDLGKLDRRVRKRKDAKTAGLTLPSAPYFAPCSILPHLPANHWNPAGAADRRLRSWQARKREDFQSRFWNKPVFGMRIPYGDLPDLEDLAPQDSDSYIGLLKGDVDGLGALLAALRFTELAKAPELQGSLPAGLPAPAGAADLFCRAMLGVVEQSILDAYDVVHHPSRRKRGEPWPFRHLIVAGDDVLILSRREVALDLAYLIGEKFTVHVENQAVVQAALRSAGLSGRQPTISFGVLFAKLGYPFDASFDLAEELLKSAKHETKRSAPSTGDVGGFVDVHWLGDSARPHLDAIRRSEQFYRDDTDKPMWLTTRPWGMTRLSDYLSGARIFQRLPRRKIKQLDEISRLGKGLSELAFLGWWSRLRDVERTTAIDGLARISWGKTDGNQPPALWKDAKRDGEAGYETCFLDLVQLTEVLEK